MTQLELPPISFKRYLDLLKRRRWQVLPVSILGLLVGGVVAFFIPRYYVSTTVIEFRGAVLDTGRGRDPMKPVISSAQISIRYTVTRALETLGWPEALSTDSEKRRAFIHGVRDRIRVADLGPYGPGRQTAHIQISYRDTDGVRAKELTETVRDLWIHEQLERLEEKASRELAKVNQLIGDAREATDNADLEVLAFEKSSDINPLDFGRNRNIQSVKSRERQKVGDLIAAADVERRRLETQLEAKTTRLGSTPRKQIVTEEPKVPQAIRDSMIVAMAQVMKADSALKNLSESHPFYPRFLAQKKAAEEEFSSLQQLVGEAVTKEVPNPEYAPLRKEVDDLTIKLKTVRMGLQRHRLREGRLQGEIRALPDKISRYNKLLNARLKAYKELEVAEANLRMKEGFKRRLIEKKPYEVLEKAEVPHRPTEPNITLLALAGSAVGLAFAIGLILLMDVIQTTFKTVDDVAHVLTLPVLGGMSHMVTSEQRRRVHARRTGTGLVAGVFLVLMVSLITIYYVAPTRLPPMVRDTLDMILGTPAPTTTAK
jgi:uncharacterized protein involved in exopolysaccharide biosynthesis